MITSPTPVSEPRGEAGEPVRLLHPRFLWAFAALFAGAFILLARHFTSHGRWGVLLPHLLIIALWLVAVLSATDLQRIWWRRITASALNVGLAVGLGFVPLNVLIQFSERGAHLADGLIVAVLVPAVAAVLAAVLSAVKLGVQWAIRRS